MQLRPRGVRSFDAVATCKFVVDESGFRADGILRHRNGCSFPAQPMCPFHNVHLYSKREHGERLSVTGCLRKDQVMTRPSRSIHE